MPKFASDNDRAASVAIDRWLAFAAEAVDDIGAWRDCPLERVWQSGAWPDRTPSPFYVDTSFLAGWIRCNVPASDPRPVEEVYAAVASWYTNHSADDIGPQHVLLALLDRAAIVLGSARAMILSRSCRDVTPASTSAPAGYVGTKAIMNDAAYRVDGMNPTRTAIQSWETRHPTKTWSDPRTNETYYQSEWVCDRMKTYKPRGRKPSA